MVHAQRSRKAARCQRERRRSHATRALSEEKLHHSHDQAQSIGSVGLGSMANVTAQTIDLQADSRTDR